MGGALVTGSFVGRVWFGTTFMSSISYNDVDYKSCVFRITRDGAIDWCHQGLNLADDDLLVFGLYIAQVKPDHVKPVSCDGPQ